MKKTITLITACALCIALASPASANNYEFSTGTDTLACFGKATSTDAPLLPNHITENIRRNKDAALLPPPYFYGSGDIPTEPSSLYHDNLPGGASASPGSVGIGIGVSTPALPPLPGFEEPTSTAALTTAPLYYADGSIGSIYVARTGKTIKVFEGEQLDNLKKGAGHFTSTSAWNGNVPICGHNRGSWAYFSFVKDLKIGDKITYATPYGTRTYEVYSKGQISEYDYSKLGWSADNILTLITCVENVRELRWSAQCREVQ